MTTDGAAVVTPTGSPLPTVTACSRVTACSLAAVAMIHADEHLFTSVVKQRETEIRAKEMELFAGHLGVIATLAAFLAEQSAEGLFLMPDNVAKSANNAWAPFFWAASALTLVLNALVLVVTTLSMIHGPTLAIRGPAGSMERAVVAMYAMRKWSMRLFFAGLLSKVAMAILLVMWKLDTVTALIVSGVFCGFTGVAVYYLAGPERFSISMRRHGLRRGELTTAGSSGTRLAPALLSMSDQPSRAAPRAAAPSPAAAATGGTACEGWLHKRSKYRGEWRERFFVLSASGRLAWSDASRRPAAASTCAARESPRRGALPKAAVMGAAHCFSIIPAGGNDEVRVVAGSAADGAVVAAHRRRRPLRGNGREVGPCWLRCDRFRQNFLQDAQAAWSSSHDKSRAVAPPRRAVAHAGSALTSSRSPVLPGTSHRSRIPAGRGSGSCRWTADTRRARAGGSRSRSRS